MLALLLISMGANILLAWAVIALLKDKAYKIWTRHAWDLVGSILIKTHVCIFADIDGLGKANAAIGYVVVDNLIEKTMRNVTRSDFAFRYYSGDEFVFALKRGSDINAFWSRLNSVLADGNMSITGVVFTDLDDAKIKLAAAKPKDSRGKRGQLIY